MHVAFDAVMLSLYLHPTAKPPKPLPDLPARIQLLIDELEAAGAKIIVATPILSEFLVLTGPKDGPVYLSELTTSDVFDIQPFDTVAAIEASEMQRKAMAAGDKKSGSESRWQVVKVDRQLVAIAKVHGVECIYSDDDGVRKIAAASGIACKGVEDLPIPPLDDQPDLFTASASTETEQPSAQSPGDGKPKESQPERARPSTRQAAQGQQQPGSSPSAVPPPRSEK